MAPRPNSLAVTYIVLDEVEHQLLGGHVLFDHPAVEGVDALLRGGGLRGGEGDDEEEEGEDDNGGDGARHLWSRKTCLVGCGGEIRLALYMHARVFVAGEVDGK